MFIQHSDEVQKYDLFMESNILGLYVYEKLMINIKVLAYLLHQVQGFQYSVNQTMVYYVNDQLSVLA